VQVAPGGACSGNPKNRLDEYPFILSRPAWITDLTWTQRRHPFPLGVVRNTPIQDWPPRFSSLESNFESGWVPFDPMNINRRKAFRTKILHMLDIAQIAPVHEPAGEPPNQADPPVELS
jgi:hypothetical protein